jgi:alkylhydroperoxidase family enzyme
MSRRGPSGPSIRSSGRSEARELREHFTDPEVVELTFLVGYTNMLNLFNNALGVRYDGEYGLLRSPAG